MKAQKHEIQIAVDIGGTFTDLVMFDRDNASMRVAKVPSTPPDYSDGVMRALEQVLDDFQQMTMFIHGTTVPLNAFLERKGAKSALLTTRGFGDVYKMARGNRLRMYDLHYRYPDPLISRKWIYEIEERMDAKGRERTPLALDQLPPILEELRQKEIESLAICFIHSYVNSNHEEAAAEFIDANCPEIFVTPSYRVCREWREFERTSTVVLNAYVSPILQKYLRGLTARFSDRGYARKVYLMQSNGGLIEAGEAESRAVLTLMSGPVGGSVGSKALSHQMKEPNLICVDMGGTSFDFSLVIDGKVAVSSEKSIGEFPVLAPMMDIHTIGAGGGSIAFCESGALRVGPQSAGAVPGPACYGRGGQEPTVTDANVVLGRIGPTSFLGGDMEIFPDLAEQAVKRLGRELHLNAIKMAEGILEVINAQMANAIRSITIGKGIDPRQFALVAFGGAGPMHAAFIARELDISRIIVPNVAGAFSAWGMHMTDLRHDASQTCIMPLSQASWEYIETQYRSLQENLAALLAAEDVQAENMRFVHSMDMRYVGQEYYINVPLPDSSASIPRTDMALKLLFDEMYESQYGHKNLAEELEIVNLRVEAYGLLHTEHKRLDEERRSPSRGQPTKPLTWVRRKAVFDDQLLDTIFVTRPDLSTGLNLDGPIIVEEKSCTTIVPPGYSIDVDRFGNLIIQRVSGQ